MEVLKSHVEQKRVLAEKYNDWFRERDYQFVLEPGGARSNYWLNAIFLDNKANRDEFLKATNASGVMTRPFWTPMNKIPMYKNCFCEDLANTSWFWDRLVCIPSSVQ